MDTRDKLLAVAHRYSELTGTTLATISTAACNDGKVLTRVSDGSDVTTRTFDKAMRWMSARWPEGAEWPEGVERPSSAKEAA